MTRTQPAVVALAIVALGACYAPSIIRGAPCDPERDNCPLGERCLVSEGRDICLGPGDVAVDAAVDAADDAPVLHGYAAVVLGDHPFTHIVATYDGAAMRLYVNGQLASSVLESRAQPAVTEPTVIGAASLTEAFFAGSIDEVAVYPSALTAARVQAHHLAGTVP